MLTYCNNIVEIFQQRKGTERVKGYQIQETVTDIRDRETEKLKRTSVLIYNKVGRIIM
jgi:hypothetical protein